MARSFLVEGVRWTVSIQRGPERSGEQGGGGAESAGTGGVLMESELGHLRFIPMSFPNLPDERDLHQVEVEEWVRLYFPEGSP